MHLAHLGPGGGAIGATGSTGRTGPLVFGPTGPTGPIGYIDPIWMIKLKYVVRFNKPVNIIELLGHIIETTKDRGLCMYLFKYVLECNKTDVSDTVSILIWNKRDNESKIMPQLWKDNITDEMIETLYAKRANKEYTDEFIARLNAAPCEILNTIIAIIKNWGLDEVAIKDAMTPAAVAAMLSAASDSDDSEDSDTDMLDKLEAFAAECDKKTFPMVSHGWEISW